MTDFYSLFEEPAKKEELTTGEREELQDALYIKADRAHKALEEWLLTYKKLGYWSSCDEDLKCIVQAYDAFKPDCMECPKFEECYHGELTACIVPGKKRGQFAVDDDSEENTEE